MGGNFFGGVCINLLRHPAWGRAQETYGEDPIHLGEFGAALVRGVQKHVMACAKHYALNSMENARFSVDVTIAPRPLHEIYLRHFRRAVDEGVASIMSAYNSVNGEWCGQNYVLLTEILKQQWGFRGFMMTDFIFGMRDSKKAALALTRLPRNATRFPHNGFWLGSKRSSGLGHTDDRTAIVFYALPARDESRTDSSCDSVRADRIS